MKPVTNNTNPPKDRFFVSPLAKKMAEEKGIDLNTVSGTGENGRIIKRDIDAYKVSASSSNNASITPVLVSGQELTEDIKNSQMRKVIAKRLSESKFSAPHYYLNVEFDMDRYCFRKQINAAETKVSLTI